MAGLGYHVRSNAKGAVIIERVENAEFVSITTYFNVWKRDSPHLKFSWPVEDIGPYCFAFTNGHRYLSNCAFGQMGTVDDNEGNDDMEDNDEGGDLMEIYNNSLDNLDHFPSPNMEIIPVVSCQYGVAGDSRDAS